MLEAKNKTKNKQTNKQKKQNKSFKIHYNFQLHSFFISIVFLGGGVSLCMLTIFLIWVLYYACNMLKIIESVAMVMFCQVKISEGPNGIHHSTK